MNHSASFSMHAGLALPLLAVERVDDTGAAARLRLQREGEDGIIVAAVPDSSLNEAACPVMLRFNNLSRDGRTSAIFRALEQLMAAIEQENSEEAAGGAVQFCIFRP